MKKIIVLLACILLPVVCFAKQEKNLYTQASSFLSPIPKEYQETINDMLRNGWKENQGVLKILDDNAEALTAFKKATLLENDGYLFGKKQGETNFSTDMHDYSAEMQLVRLLLLEGKLFETQEDFKKAEEDYLAVSRFLVHLSQQRFGIMITHLVSFLTADFAYNFLDQSTQTDSFSKDYLADLRNNLSLVRRNQDFLKAALEEEAATVKNFIHLFEQKAKKGATFSQLFGINPTGKIDKKVSSSYTAKEKELNALLNSPFFIAFYQQADKGIEDIFATSIVAARENNLALIENKVKYYQENAQKMGTPINSVLRALELAANTKNKEKIIADTMAKIYLGTTTPNFSKFISKYYSFNAKLKTLIEKASTAINK